MKQPIIEITERIREKSRPTRSAYLERVALMKRSMVKQFGKNVLRELDT